MDACLHKTPLSISYSLSPSALHSGFSEVMQQSHKYASKQAHFPLSLASVSIALSQGL